jgi:hypothetical protein
VSSSFHKTIGWIGTVIAVCDYGLFALGLLSELVFFSLGNVASVLLVWALFHDRTWYAASLQTTFLVLNTIGIVRILLS